MTDVIRLKGGIKARWVVTTNPLGRDHP
ncbi:MAG: hypothetical protein QOE51_1361, partial [Actinoplanes sp.]|nr:hypothetical protein [Actinoplanes sp.]